MPPLRRELIIKVNLLVMEQKPAGYWTLIATDQQDRWLPHVATALFLAGCNESSGLTSGHLARHSAAFLFATSVK